METRLTERRELHKCGDIIEVDTKLLFRGIGYGGQFDNRPSEEFTATSMSIGVAAKYANSMLDKRTLMVIHVPDGKVHGLVVADYEQRGNQRTDQDSEILLLNPVLSRCEEDTEPIRKYIEEVMKIDLQTMEDLQVWIYDGTTVNPKSGVEHQN